MWKKFGFANVLMLCFMEQNIQISNQKLPMDPFKPLPRPHVVFHGAATVVQERPLADVIELLANATHYLVVISVPRGEVLPDGEHQITLDMTPNGEVFIEGETSAGTMWKNPSTEYIIKRRVQLLPDEPWGITIYLPGPVDILETRVSYNSPGTVEVRVRRKRQQQ